MVEAGSVPTTFMLSNARTIYIITSTWNIALPLLPKLGRQYFIRPPSSGASSPSDGDFYFPKEVKNPNCEGTEKEDIKPREIRVILSHDFH